MIKYNHSLSAEKWQWEAHYVDGSVLKQYDNDREHLFGEIQQDKLSSIKLVAKNLPPVSIDWDVGKKLILFTRNIIRYGLGTNEKKKICIWCVGYETNVDKNIWIILPDDSIIFTKDIDTLDLMELI